MSSEINLTINFAKKLRMSEIKQIIMVFEDQVKIIEGEDAVKFQKHMNNLNVWGKKANPPMTIDVKPKKYVKQ